MGHRLKFKSLKFELPTTPPSGIITIIQISQIDETAYEAIQYIAA